MSVMDNVKKGKYVFETEYAPKNVSGINYFSTGKDVIISFFDEVPTFPNSFEFDVSDNGEINQKDIVSDENELTRIIQARIRMGKNEAIAMLRFVADSLEGENNDNTEK